MKAQMPSWKYDLFCSVMHVTYTFPGYKTYIMNLQHMLHI